MSDALNVYKNNPYGKKSIELGDSAYQTFAKPVLPLFAKPYGYVSPYVQKVDLIGAGVLHKFDERVPVLTKPTGEIYANSKQVVFFPVVKTKETTDHLFAVYNAEVKKVGGDGVVTYGKAFISTGITITQEALTWIGDIITNTKEKAKEANSGGNGTSH